MRRGLAWLLFVLQCLNTAQAAKPARPSSSPACQCSVALPAAAPDMRGTGSVPLAVNVLSVPPVMPPERDWSGWVVAGFTGALSLVTLGLAIFTYKLWKSTVDLVREGNNTAKHELRAYVGTSSAVHERADRGGRIRVALTVKNYGRTPAYGFALSAAVEVSSSPRDLSESSGPSQLLGHLPPGAEYTAHLDLSVAVASQSGVQVAGASAGYVFGRINYVDIFCAQHYTEFCMRDNEKDSTFRLYGSRNFTDDELPDQKT